MFMSLNIQTLETSQFIVCRDGQLDEEWLEDYLTIKRRENTREIAHMAISKAGEATLAVGRTVGKGIVTWLESIG